MTAARLVSRAAFSLLVAAGALAFAGCAAIAAVGAWRALQALRMRAPAHWLERELAHRDRFAGCAAPN